MAIRIFLLFLVAIAPAVACLGYAWRGRWKDFSESPSPQWRVRILTITARVATLSELLAVAFLVQGFHGDRQSYAEPASVPWAIANWVSLVGWVFTLVSAAIGRGRARRPLLLWTIVFPLIAWLIVMIGYDY